MGRRGNEPADEATESAWGMFLDTLIRRLGDVQAGESLALVAPAGTDGARDELLIRSDRERGRTRVTRGRFGSAAADRLLARADREGGMVPLAEAIVRAARDEIGLPHPQLFTAHAHGAGAAHLAECLGLAEEGGIREPATGAPPDRGEAPATPDWFAEGEPADLAPMVLEELRDLGAGEPYVDDDGDVVADLHGTRTFVLFSPDGATLEVAALVATGVYSRRSAAVELDLLNRKGMWSTWCMRDRDIWLRSQLFARPLVRSHLRWTLRTFAEDLHGNRDELAYRLGARVA